MKTSPFISGVASLLFSLGAYAQQVTTAGIRAGLSIPNLTAGRGNRNPLNTGYSSRLGPNVGLFAELQFSALFSLQPAVEYSSQGGKKDGLQALPTPAQVAAMYPPGQAPAYLYADYNSEAKLNYLMFPVLAKFQWSLTGTALYAYVAAGPYVGLLLSAHQVTRGQSPLYTDPAGEQPLPGGPRSFNDIQNVKNDLHTFNLGFEGNLGLGLRFKRSRFFLEAGGNYGFLNIQKNTADGKNQTGAAVISMGYGYMLVD